MLYIGSSDLRRVSAIAPENGRVLWRTDIYGWTFGTPLLVGEAGHGLAGAYNRREKKEVCV